MRIYKTKENIQYSGSLVGSIRLLSEGYSSPSTCSKLLSSYIIRIEFVIVL